MDFDLTEEQSLLKDSVERLMAERYDFEARRRHLATPDGWSREMWRHYAEMGLLGLAFEERHGGVSAGPVETMIVMEALGRALAVEPYLATVVLCGGLLREAGSEAQRDDLLPRMAQGALVMALAHAEPQARDALADVTTAAKRDGDGFVLDGGKTLALHADGADLLIVSARTAGDRSDTDGVGLFLIDPRADGVALRGYPTQDDMRAADITLDAVRVGPEAVIGDPGNGLALVERAIEAAIAARAAESIGAMEALHALTVDFLKTRKQFGTAIGTFQVLQHRAVDMLMALEQARSMAMFATMTLAEPDADQRRRAIAAAKVQIGRSARFVGETAIQLHGAIGMTMEHPAGHYFKRLTMIDLMFGDADHHLERLADAGGLAT